MRLSDRQYVSAPPSTHNSYTPAIQGSTSATLALAFIAVSLRFTARRLSKAGVWYDDWLIVLALFCGFGLWFDSAIWMVEKGLGEHIVYGDIDSISKFLLSFYVSEIIWTNGVAVVKLSILLFYLRLFGQRQSSRLIIQGLLGLVLCWWIAILFLTVFQCTPPSKFWAFSSTGICRVTPSQMSLASAVPHIITDIMILAAPIPLLWPLQMRYTQKMMLYGILSLGIFVTVVSGVRLNYLILYTKSEGTDMTFKLINTAIWTSVEVNTAIVCACLPCLRPLLSFIADKVEAFRKRQKSVKQGKELLLDMLPRRKQGHVDGATAGEKLLEMDTDDVVRGDLSPLEVEAVERPIPELVAVDRVELGSNEVASELELGRGPCSHVELEATTGRLA